MEKNIKIDNIVIGCDVRLKSNHYSTGIVVGESKKGKGVWEVEWDDGCGVTHISCINIERY